MLGTACLVTGATHSCPLSGFHFQGTGSDTNQHVRLPLWELSNRIADVASGLGPNLMPTLTCPERLPTWTRTVLIVTLPG